MDNKNINKIFSVLEKEVPKYNVPIVNLIKVQTKDKFKILISTILSARTKDEVTWKASQGLFKVANNAKKLDKLSEIEIQKLIFPVGFYKIKAKHIKETAKLILENKNKIPVTLNDLLSLPGVGRKTANLYLAVALEKDAICVDTHVHRISNRLGWIKTKSPLETEKALQKILPKKYWKKINFYFVSHGQNICKPISPKCPICKIEGFCEKTGVKYKTL